MSNNSLYPRRPSPLFISQSLMKTMTKSTDWYQDDSSFTKTYCPRQVYHFFFTKDYKEHKDVYDKGTFGESLLLGYTASMDTVTDLPKHKKTGAARVDEDRIRLMAKIAKIKFAYHQIAVHEGLNTQVPLAAHIERDVYIRTRLDLFPTPFIADPKITDSDSIFACIDTKFPKSLDGFGDFNWRQFEHLDHCQPDSIYWQFEHLDLSLIKKFYPDFEKEVGFDNIYTPKILSIINEVMFYYFIIAYDKVTDENIMIRSFPKTGVDDNQNRQAEFRERMNRVISLVEYHFEMGFDPVPFIDIKRGRGCHKCPINIKAKPYLNNPCGYCEDFIEL